MSRSAVESALARTLVGRDTLLQELRAALDAVVGGRGRTVLLTGPSGVGKTRIAAELRQLGQKKGFGVASASANPVERDIPYALVAELFAPLLRTLDPATLATVTRGQAAALAAVFPMLETLHRPGVADTMTPEERKARMLWALSQLVARLTAKRPLIVVADNLQWADAGSIELLHFIARQCAGEALLVVGIWTTDEGDTDPAYARLLRSLTSLDIASVLRVAPLSLDETERLVSTVFDIAPSAVREFAALLYGWTRGNPLFVREVLLALVATGTLHERDGSWFGWDVRTLALPASVRELFRGRIATLGTPARELLELVAVAGTRVSHALLESIAPGDSEARLLATDELRRRGVLTESSTGDDVHHEFVHPLLREVVLDGIGATRRRHLRGVIARGLAARVPLHDPRLARELAQQLLHAPDDAVDRATAVRHLIAAAERALAVHADTEAAAYLTRATALLSAEDAALRHTVTALLARARLRCGEYAAAAALWSDVAAHARAQGDTAAVAHAALRAGLACYWGGDRVRALAAYDGALDAATGDDAMVARILIARAAVHQENGDRDAALADLVHAAAAAESTSDPALRARAARGLLLLHVWTGPAALVREYGRDTIALASEAGEPTLVWSAHWAMALTAGLTGDAPGVAMHVRECERIAHEVGSPVLTLWTAEVSIEYASGTGDWDAGLALASRVIPLARSLEHRTLLPRLLVWTAIMQIGRGDLESADAALAEAWSVSGAGDPERARRHPHAAIPAHTGRAAYHLARGEHAEAIRVAEAGLALADGTGYVVWAVHRLLPILGEAVLWSGDLERAASLSARMRLDATQLEHRLGLVWADACDALILMFRDDERTAVPRLEAAATALEAVPFPEYAARVRRQLASAHWELGDADAARRELRRAHDLLVPLRAAGDLDGVRAQLREYGVRPPQRARASSRADGALPLTAREAEIAALVAAHRTNDEIGVALGISGRTVSTHLSNIFQKLDVRSRAELADRVRGIPV